MARFLPLLILLCAPSVFPQSSSSILPEKETLDYSIEWRLITAGKATLQFTGGHDPQVNLHVESIGLVSKLFKVLDAYSASLNQSLCTQSILLTSHEGRRSRETKVTYNSETHKADYLERDTAKDSVVLSKEIEIPACVHDVVGGLYYLRTLNIEPGHSIEIPVSDGKKSVMAKVDALQREEVKTDAGTFKTVRYEIGLFNDVLYRRSAHLYVWLTDDHRKLPVQIRVRMQFTIGTITLQLDKYE
ncbi:MAG TPA: DUF3108 domain-containing protein [Bryobacteraceae bacterium]|nr:DUF3108 domain-containing protein [Bryobacteraceae bacterium]